MTNQWHAYFAVPLAPVGAHWNDTTCFLGNFVVPGRAIRSFVLSVLCQRYIALWRFSTRRLCGAYFHALLVGHYCTSVSSTQMLYFSHTLRFKFIHTGFTFWGNSLDAKGMCLHIYVKYYIHPTQLFRLITELLPVGLTEISLLVAVQFWNYLIRANILVVIYKSQYPCGLHKFLFLMLFFCLCIWCHIQLHCQKSTVCVHVFCEMGWDFLYED